MMNKQTGGTRSRGRGRACHPEGGFADGALSFRARFRDAARGIRNPALPFLLLLALVGIACEDLPEAPNIPPSATFIYNPVSPIVAGETPVTFNAVGSRDSDGSISSYIWNFGDGTADQVSTSPTITHVFADTPVRCIEVTYAVLLTVVDDKNDSSSASQQVRVTEVPVAGSAQCR